MLRAETQWYRCLFSHYSVDSRMGRCFKKERKSQKALLRVRSIYARKLQLHGNLVRVRSITAPNSQLSNFINFDFVKPFFDTS